MIPILLAWALATSTPMAASPLEQARTLFTEGRVEAGLDAVRTLRQAGGLDTQALAETHLLEGMGLALLDDEGATLAFHRALTLDPAVDPHVQQTVVREPFEAARRSKVEPALDVAWRLLGASEAATPGLEVRLVVDVYGLVHGVRPRVDPRAHREENTSPEPSILTEINVSAPLAYLPHAVLPVVLVDRDGNEVQVLTESSAEPLVASSGADAEPDRFALAAYPWGTLAGAGVMTVGLLMAVGSGAMVAAYDRGLQLPAVVDPVARMGFLVGLAAGLLVVLAGGAGVVADQILFGDLFLIESAVEPATAGVDAERPATSDDPAPGATTEPAAPGSSSEPPSDKPDPPSG